MFNKKRRRTIDDELNSLVAEMKKYPKDSEEYRKLVDSFTQLCKAKSHDKGRYIDKNTIILVAGNLIGIGFILSYEKLNVVTSKALSFVLKGRV